MRSWPETKRQAFLASLTSDERLALQYSWEFWAREEQLEPPGTWFAFLILAGRGWGKSRTLSEWVRARIESGQSRRMALVARTAADVRDVMIWGESGIMAVSPPWFRPEYNPSKRRLIWPNGAIATCYSAETPDQLRGPQHDAAALDELCVAAGTLIATSEGAKRVENVVVGDCVATRKGFRPVSRAWKTSDAAQVLRLTTTCGKELTGTAGHPVFAEGRGFVPLSLLAPGDTLRLWETASRVLGSAAGCTVVKSVEPLNERVAVYNIEVEGEHEYFANGILTHNCSWDYPETFDNLLFGLRLGKSPRLAIATTPKPRAVLKQLLDSKDTHVVRGSTYENLSNLAPVFRRTVLQKYEGTTIGRQEIYAEVLSDLPGAILKRSAFRRVDILPKMLRIVVGVDPAVSDAENACHTGIVVAGVGVDKMFYVLEDASKHAHVTEWARIVVTMYRKWEANLIIGEANNGGDLVEALIKSVDPTVAYRKVHASRGKRTRAEPIAMLYEQGKVMHYGVGFPHLEDEFCSYDPLQNQKSPDRLDAAVWALTYLQEHKPTPSLKNIVEASPKRYEPLRNL